jgi:hypothetical protein
MCVVVMAVLTSLVLKTHRPLGLMTYRAAHMERAVSTPAVAANAAAVTEVVVALESSLYGPSTFSQAGLEDEWLELDLEQDARVVRDGERVVGYGVVRERGEVWRVEGYVHLGDAA